MSAIPVNFDGKQDDPNWTPQPPPGRKGTSFVLPPDCKVAFTQRLLRVSLLSALCLRTSSLKVQRPANKDRTTLRLQKGPKIFSLTGREREADGLV